MALSSFLQEMPLDEFLDEVGNSISPDWHNFIESRGLKDSLDGQLKLQHSTFRPFRNGLWDATPALQDVFAWTACPAEQIQAIFVDMKPLRPVRCATYQSIGCAFGAKRRRHCGSDFDIFNLTTIKKFLRLVYEVTSAPWTTRVETDLKEKFRNGFNPLYLSGNNHFLFLQLQLTTGSNTEDKDENLYQWATEFVVPLLEQIGFQNELAGRSPIPVIQLYNRQCLEDSLRVTPGLKVFRPTFMNYDSGPDTRHISGFTNEMFRQYVHEISADQYEEHREVFLEIRNVIDNNPECLTFQD